MEELIPSYPCDLSARIAAHYGPNMAALAEPMVEVYDVLAPMGKRKPIWGNFQDVLTRPVFFESNNPMEMGERRMLEGTPMASNWLENMMVLMLIQVYLLIRRFKLLVSSIKREMGVLKHMVVLSTREA